MSILCEHGERVSPLSIVRCCRRKENYDDDDESDVQRKGKMKRKKKDEGFIDEVCA